MKAIKWYVDEIAEEIEGAKEYAERYLECRAKGGQYASMFKEMSQDELKHADNLHTMAVNEIQQLNTVYTPPVEMQEAWDKSHKEYVEKVAWIRQMLAMG